LLYEDGSFEVVEDEELDEEDEEASASYRDQKPGIRRLISHSGPGF
jgi:hypothetical protein